MPALRHERQVRAELFPSAFVIHKRHRNVELHILPAPNRIIREKVEMRISRALGDEFNALSKVLQAANAVKPIGLRVRDEVPAPHVDADGLR